MGKHAVVRSDEHKQRIAEALKRSWTPARRAALSAARKGAANPFFGKHHTEEANAKRAMPGELNPFYGKHHTKKNREALSELKSNTSPRLAKLYGVSTKEYRRKLAQGYRWCPGHKGWFRSKNKRCAAYCEECLIRYRFKKNYKQDYDTWYAAKLAEQDGGCAICHSSLVAGRREKKFCTDHNHKTNTLRGLLCKECNCALARLEAHPTWTVSALEYLRKYA